MMKNKPAIFFVGICFLVSLFIMSTTLLLGHCSKIESADPDMSGDVRRACSALNTKLDFLINTQAHKDVSAAQNQFVGMGPLITLCTGGEVKLGLEDVDDYSVDALQKRIRFVQSKMKR